MSRAELRHIFDNSTCLTKRQMKDYVKGIMTNEEAHAVEVHLNSCPLCNDAVEGLFEQKEAAIPAFTEINADFLKDHFGLSNPHIHLNTIAASHATRPRINVVKNKNRNRISTLRVSSIAAGLLLIVALIWFSRMDHHEEKPIAQILQESAKQEQQVVAPTGSEPPGAIAMNKSEKRPSVVKDVEDAMVEAAPAAAASVVQDTVVARQSFAADADNTKADRKEEEVAVSAYKVPLIEKEEKKIIAPEDIQKMPTRSAPEVATPAAGANDQKSFGNSYDRDASTTNVETIAAKPKRAVKTPSAPPDRLEQADQLFRRRSYGDALNVYTKEMQNSDYTRKAEATLGAARCYIALGNKAKAKALLQPLADESSGQTKRQAKKLLKELEE